MVCCKAIKFMMKKSPTHEPYQACYYEACELDLHENLSQLLEEAKQNVVNEAKLREFTSAARRKLENRNRESEKEKKSWKSNVITWWKGEKKSKKLGEGNNKVCGKGKGHVSGPIPIYNCGKGPDVKYRRPTSSSGPLFFKHTIQIPYVPLHQQNFPRAAAHNYGPLYVVT